jgi:hypothetical protein
LALPAVAGGPAVPCPWDLDGDGDVGVTDFLALLAAWGPNPGDPADFDGDDIVGITDFLALLAAWGPCPVCGPGAGPCFEPHAGPGCDDVECCTLVCDDDPLCCDAQWDENCRQAALVLCENLPGACCLPDGTCAELDSAACDGAGGYFHGISVDCASAQCSFVECPGTGNCLFQNKTPGCSDFECCNFVCSVAPTCCEATWDANCAQLALDLCGNCGDPQAGNCFVDNGTPGCTDPDCCATVCHLDTFCCLTLWDELCADEAAEFCNQLDCSDPARCQAPNQVLALMSNGALYTQADNLVLSAPDDAPVNGLCWWGTYFSSQNCGPGPDDFTVNYYADANALPGALLASFSQGGGTLAVAPPVATGNVIGGGSPMEYEHTAIHADLVLSPGVCYWVEIINTGPGDPCNWFWESSSEGDDQAAHTVEGGPWDPKTRDFAFCLNVPLYGAPPCPCPLECPPGAIDEAESCGTSTNDGCNVDPPAFATASCGDVICGSAWAEGNLRDTDWYLVNHTGGSLAATLTSQFPGVVFIADINLNTCVAGVLSTGCSDNCAPINEASANLSAGQYLVFVAPGDCNGNGIFDGIPCGTSNDYTLEITCPPVGSCCVGNDCEITTASLCASQGGDYGGDGTSCPTTGACCNFQSQCITTDIFTCITQGGTFLGMCVDCADVDCSCTEGVGACCLPDGTCQLMTGGACIFGGGIYQGDCTTCSACP